MHNLDRKILPTSSGLVFFSASTVVPGGYTLIELVVSIGIMVMLLGGGIVGYIGYNERQQVRNTTDEIVVFLESAKQKAAVRQKPDDCDYLRGYQVETTEQGLGMFALCSVTQEGEYEIQDTSLSQVEISELITVDPISISFLTLYAGVAITQPSDGEITISFGETNQTIRVDEGGAIEIL